MIYLFEKVLSDNVREDFTTFRNYLLSLSPAEILKYSYEYTAKQDLLAAFEATLKSGKLSAEQIKVLSRSSCPLEEYMQFINRAKLISAEELEQALRVHANAEIRKQRLKKV